MSRQLTHTEDFFSIRKFPVIILADNVTGEANIGSIFRLADAFNVEKIVFCGAPVNLKSNRLKRTARATEKLTPNEHWEKPVTAFSHYLSLGYRSLALEITSDSIAIDKLSFESDHKLMLILGNERTGISSEILALAETKLHISMYGKNSSMNVAQAAAIALYEITKTLPCLPD